nr:ORF1 [Torque teno felis virus]
MWRRRRRGLRRWPRRWNRRRRFKRRYHRRGYGRRRRRGVRNTLVTEYIPGRHETIWINGWEPLGNLCHADYATTRAAPYKAVEPQAGSQGQWHGTWGAHYLTFDNLISRALAYWNQWSTDWSTYDYIKFCGGIITIPQIWPVTWLFNTDEYLQVKLKDYDPPSKEDQWIHPGIMLNNPKTHIILPYNQMQRKRLYKIPVKPPPGWKGFQRLPTAGAFICLHYSWTWCDLQHAFFDPSYNTNTSKCSQEPWWTANQKISKWVNRQKYKTCNSQLSDQSWGPFLPCKFGDEECSLWFHYKLKFKAIGNALWRSLPRNILSGGMVPEAPGPDNAETETSDSEELQPESTADIWRGDLNSHGLLKRRAFERITGLNTSNKRRRLSESEQRLKLIASKLRYILRKRGLLRRMGDNPPNPPLKKGG